MEESKFNELKNRIRSSFKEYPQKSKGREKLKDYYWGFITGLLDYGIVTQTQYEILRDNEILCYK